MALTTRLSVSLTALYTSALDLSTVSSPLSLSQQYDLSSGTGAGAADMVWHDRRTLAASGSEELDLAASLTGPTGATLTFARVKALVVRAASANTNNVVVGGAASNTWVGPFGDATDTLAIQPGMILTLIATGATAWPVTASTGDLLKVANSGGTTGVTYDIAIIGASA